MAQRVDLSELHDYVAHCQLHPLINALREKKRIVVIVGAGISASAGIPTFDSMPVGRRKIFDMNMYNNLESTALLNQMMCDMYQLVQAASPTQFHLVLAALAEEGRLLRLYTQNIDGIDTQLAPLKTQIPLPKKKPWPTTVQLHGDLRTVRCQTNPTHLSRFNPAHFTSGSLPSCAVCEEHERLNEGRSRPVPVLRPRIWLYHDDDYPDAEAIDIVRAADSKARPDAVIVAGTALKVESAKIFARDICRAAREGGGFAAWINLKAPPRDLDCFNLVVEGDCDTVAMHVSSWWLKECPKVLSDTQIQSLQEKCKLFVARSAEAALNRALAEVDDDSLSKILQQHERRILNVKDSSVSISAERLRRGGINFQGGSLFMSTGFTQPSGLTTSKAVNYNAETVSQYYRNPLPTSTLSESSAALPKLLDNWETEMSKRLSKVVIQRTKIGRKSTSVVTRITNLGYREAHPEKSLWRLKPGEYLNDEVINAYLELLRKSGVAKSQSIQNTFILEMNPHKPWKRFSEVINTGEYSIYIPVNENWHWTFAVITSAKDGPVHWAYYDSLGNKPPQKFLDWIYEVFLKEETEEVAALPNPKQKNTVDCGLFVLMGIRLLSAGRRHLSQAQSDDFIPTFRQRVLAELLASSLNPSSSQFEEFQLKEAQADTIPLQEGVGDERISATVDNQNYPADGTSSLFVSPSPIPDPREDTEADSLDALDKSEEEIIQVKSSTKKVSREKKSPFQIALSFAQETAIVKMLREAVSIERASQKGSRNPNVDNMRLADLWLIISTEKRALKQRYLHYEFSRHFWVEMGNLNRRPHQRGPVPKATIAAVMSKLNITNQTNWKHVLQVARRASVWTELADIFKNDVEHPSVVLCAVSDATYTLETMTLTNRKAFFETIHSRLKEPNNGILARLKAADALYWMVMLSSLPAKDLPIESTDGDLPFEQMVSSGKQDIQ